MLKPNHIVIGASLLTCIVALTGCKGYEDGFEYQTRTTLEPLNGSRLRGTAVMGHAIDGRNARLRIVLQRAVANREYQVRFFDAPGCGDRDLAGAMRIDDASRDINSGKAVWFFASEPLVVAGNASGRVEKEFPIVHPTGSSMYEYWTYKYPTVVVYTRGTHDNVPEPALEPVACGRIASPPANQRPHT